MNIQIYIGKKNFIRYHALTKEERYSINNKLRVMVGEEIQRLTPTEP